MGRVADRRRERLRKDTRLDWRDPNMPCIRDTLYENKNGRKKLIVGEPVPPEEVQQEAKEDLKELELVNWRLDPSYHWATMTKSIKEYARENPEEPDDGEEDAEAEAKRKEIEGKLFSAQRRHRL